MGDFHAGTPTAPCCNTCAKYRDGDAPSGTDNRLLIAPRHQLRLVVHSYRLPEGRLEVTPGQSTIVIGRSAARADVQVPDMNLSKRQCAFTFENDRVYVQDLGSACGTIVNGCTIRSPVQLTIGAKVEFGDSHAEVIIVGDA